MRLTGFRVRADEAPVTNNTNQDFSVRSSTFLTATSKQSAPEHFVTEVILNRKAGLPDLILSHFSDGCPLVIAVVASPKPHSWRSTKVVYVFAAWHLRL